MSTIPKTRTAVDAPPIADSDLPEGWTFAYLKDLTSNPKQDIVDGPFGSNLKASEYVEIGVPIIRLQNIDRNKFIEKNIRRVTTNKAGELSRHSFRAGDLVITKLGDPVGKACIVPSSLPFGIIVADVVRVRIDERLALNTFVTYAVNSPTVATDLSFYVKGSTRPRVNLNHIRSLEIHLAPLDEQKRIAAKINELFTEVNASRAHLAKATQNLKRFRQSVFAAACSGCLTEDWRKVNRLSDWQYTSLSKASVQIQIGPFGTQLHRHQYIEGGIPLINPMHIKEGGIYPTPDCTVSPAMAADLAQYRMKNGDVVLARRGEMGRAAVIGDTADGYICGTGSLFIRPLDGKIDPDFLSFVLRSPQSKSALEETAVGSTMTNLNQGIVGELEFPEVHIREQKEIVRRVGALFTLTHKIEKLVEAATKRAEMITQALLVKAFRGELVPTEAELARRENRTYEHASVLLKRIKSEREKVSTSTNAAGRRPAGKQKRSQLGTRRK